MNVISGIFPSIEIIDLSPLYKIIIFGILLFAGIIAFKYVPGKKLNLIIALGLIGLGFGILLNKIYVGV